MSWNKGKGMAMLKRISIAVVTTTLVVSGCCCQKPAEKSGSPTVASKKGYTKLFDGKNLTGWEPVGSAHWVVENGLLVGTQGEKNAAGELLTTRSFRDFEVVVTYRLEWPCNSGVWFRYQTPGKAYQADILEYKNPVAYSGSLYCPGYSKIFLAINADQTLENHTGWNTMKVRAQGDHLQIWLNDRQTADVHDTRSDSGKIGFQVHPGAEFGPMKIVVRAVLVKEL
jgi:hypothetical protein